MPGILWKAGGDTRVNAARIPRNSSWKRMYYWKLPAWIQMWVFCLHDCARPFESESPTIHTERIIHYSRVAYVIESPVYIVCVLFKRYSIHGLRCDVLRFRPLCMHDKACEVIYEVLTAVLVKIKVFLNCCLCRLESTDFLQYDAPNIPVKRAGVGCAHSVCRLYAASYNEHPVVTEVT